MWPPRPRPFSFCYVEVLFYRRRGVGLSGLSRLHKQIWKAKDETKVCSMVNTSNTLKCRVFLAQLVVCCTSAPGIKGGGVTPMGAGSTATTGVKIFERQKCSLTA